MTLLSSPLKVGDQVICTKSLKALPDEEIGVILSVNPPNESHPSGWVTIGYPQYYPIEDGKGGYKFSKYVYVRSADIDTLIY